MPLAWGIPGRVCITLSHPLCPMYDRKHYRGALDYNTAKEIELPQSIPVAPNSDISVVAANIDSDNVADFVISTFGFNTFGQANILPGSPVQDDDDDIIVQQQFPVRTISWLKKINPVVS